MNCVRHKKQLAIIFLISMSIIIYSWIHDHNRLKALEWRKKYFETDYPTDEDTKADQIVYKKLKRNAEIKEKIQSMKTIIKEINEKQHVINNNRFKSFKSENSVLVIQVHNDITYLAVLLDSMRRVIGITRCLMIFCHDYYDDKINNVIRNITFGKVMQIFYPYSVQLHPNIYPGGESKIWYSANGQNPKKKRNEILAQKKLFWWWIMNQVFDHLEIVKSYNGYMYFLETEQYVASDIIYMAKMIEHLRPVFCPECVILGMGTHRPQQDHYHLRKARLLVGTWGWSNYTNSGFGFNRTIWNSIKKLSEHFCHFADHSWDHSLRYLASKTPQKQFFMLSTEGPRVFPMAGCGINGTGINCTLSTNYFDVKKFVWTVRDGLFPHSFDVKHDEITERDVNIERGEWGDVRDRELCMFFASKGRREYY